MEAGSEPPWAIRLVHGRLFIDVPSFVFDGVRRAAEVHELRAESDHSFFTELEDTVIFTLDPATKSATEMKVTMPRVGYAGTLRRTSVKPGGVGVKWRTPGRPLGGRPAKGWAGALLGTWAVRCQLDEKRPTR